MSWWSAAARPAWRSATCSPGRAAGSRSSTPAAAWRARWDPLVLFTPVRYDSLPGRAFPGDADTYPRRDDVVGYLEDYARDFELPVELDSAVRAVRARRRRLRRRARRPDLRGRPGRDRHRPVPGPCVPDIARRLDPTVVQMHSDAYERPRTSRCSSSAAATRAFRSPRSSPGTTTCTSRSALGRRRSPTH